MFDTLPSAIFYAHILPKLSTEQDAQNGHMALMYANKSFVSPEDKENIRDAWVRSPFCTLVFKAVKKKDWNKAQNLVKNHPFIIKAHDYGIFNVILGLIPFSTREEKTDIYELYHVCKDILMESDKGQANDGLAILQKQARLAIYKLWVRIRVHPEKLGKLSLSSLYMHLHFLMHHPVRGQVLLDPFAPENRFIFHFLFKAQNEIAPQILFILINTNTIIRFHKVEHVHFLMDLLDFVCRGANISFRNASFAYFIIEQLYILLNKLGNEIEEETCEAVRHAIVFKINAMYAWIIENEEPNLQKHFEFLFTDSYEDANDDSLIDAQMALDIALEHVWVNAITHFLLINHTYTHTQ